ncbi:MAG: 50S ribosomal protein L22 [Candidatus Paceibacterota bacterium]
MSKENNNKKIATAKLRYLRVSPKKVRLVANLVRGLPINEAEAQLMISSRRPSVNILKLLQSAVANAINNEGMDKSKLHIRTIKVDGGPALKRGLPRARGMMDLIRKEMSHITIELEERESKKAKFVIPENTKKDKDQPKKSKKDPSDKQDDPFENRELERPEKKELKAKKPGMARKFFRRKSV